MKRFHVHVAVADLDRSIAFYSGLFNAPPTVSKPDYAKWMVEDPRLNFAISTHGGATGVDHLGLQADDEPELAGIRAAFVAADASTVVDQPGASCCYARSNKHWLTDPQGIAWEGYRSLGQVELYGGALRADQGAHAEPTHDANGSGAADLAESERLLQSGDVKVGRSGACCGPTAAAAGDTDLALPERSLQPGDVKGERSAATLSQDAQAMKRVL
ncbi:MAG: VOC family protein [Casimicrobiaceae bacterium]